MILGFKQRFTVRIQQKIKIHTFREDRKDRWKAGNSIQAFIGVRQKWMEKIFEDYCKSTQKLLLVYNDKLNILHVTVERRRLKPHEIHVMAINDGFDDVVDLVDWFFPMSQDGVRKVTMWSGKIIHWTDLKY